MIFVCDFARGGGCSDDISAGIGRAVELVCGRWVAQVPCDVRRVVAEAFRWERAVGGF